MNNQVLATVGSREITQKELQFFINNLNPQTAAQFKSEQGQRALLEELINQELFYLDALENNLQEEESFKEQLKNLEENLLKQYSLDKTLSSVSIEEEELMGFYNENSSMFQTPESVRASHILVKEKETADNILKEISNGLPFEDAAKKYSTCPSNTQGGDLGFFTKGKMVPEFEKTAFSMDKGEISDPVQTQFGFHIIQLLDKKEASTASFEEVKENLKRQLLSKKQQNLYFTKIGELKNKFSITIHSK